MGAYLLGVDIGTSACKAALFDENGDIAAQASREYPVRYPSCGMAEQDPDEWWSAACACIREIIETSSVPARDIAGIGVDGQSWSAVAVDRTGAALCPTPIWTDTRSAKQCSEILARVPEKELFAVSGNPLAPGYSLPKILWYKKCLPDVYGKTAYILQSNSFIAFRLTGAVSQDLSQGYGFSCFDIRKGKWLPDIAERIGIRTDVLPPLFASHEIIGRITKEASALTKLPEGVPVAAGGLDAACAALGAGVIDNGQTQEQGGQAGGMSICLDAFAAHEKLISGCHVVPGRWLLQGGTTGGGGALKWLRENVCPELSFEDMSALAASVPPGSGGLVFLPYMAGERSPIWNPSAKGVFFGLDYGKTRAHLIRAVMEGVAYSLRHNLETAAQAGAEAAVLRTVGGSAKSDVWTQIKADATGKRIETTTGAAASALGAAMLAGIGAGVYGTFAEAVRKTVRLSRSYMPDSDNAKIYNDGYAKYLELYGRLEPMMPPCTASGNN